MWSRCSAGCRSIVRTGYRVKVEYGASPSFAAFESELPASWEGPPPHVHRSQDEAFYVLDGAVNFWLDGRSQLCPVGSFIFVPRGSSHGFGTTNAAARILVVVTPDAIRLVEGVYQLSTGNTPPAPEAVAAVYEQYDSEVLPQRLPGQRI